MVKLNKREKEFLNEHVDLFENYDIDTAVRELATICIENGDDPDLRFEFILEFLAQDSDLFNHVSDDTCELLKIALHNDEIVIEKSYTAKSLYNPNIKIFPFTVEADSIKEINCPNVEKLDIDTFVVAEDPNLKDPNCIIKFPELDTSNADKASCIYQFDNYTEWSNGVYVETNQKAVNNFIDLLEIDDFTPKEIANVKKHLRVI